LAAAIWGLLLRVGEGEDEGKRGRGREGEAPTSDGQLTKKLIKL